MLIAVTLSEGAVPTAKHGQVVKEIADSFLEHHKLEGNIYVTKS
ncbi:MAG: hypothetical protein ACJA2E_000530 [Arenicella sp.]|jgi:hypothetical protein